MSSDLYSSGLVRYPHTGTFTGSAASITGPVVTSTPANATLIQIGGVKPKMFRCRGVQIMFAANADNATGNFGLWARQAIMSPASNEIANGPVISLGTGTFTAGNIVSPANSTDFFADTITFTASAFLTNLLTTLGAASPLVHSPADNTPAVLRIEDIGNYDLYVDVWRAGASPATDVETYVEVNT